MGAINDPFMDLEYMVYQLKYDSVHKRYPGTIATKVDGDKKFLVVDGKAIQVFAEKDPAAIPWGACGANYVCESFNILGLALIGAAMANPPTNKKEARALFKDIDTNGDKRVDAEELVLYVESLEYGSQEDARSIMSDADKNGNGQLSFKEFWSWGMDAKTDDDNQQKRTRWLTLNWNWFG